MIGHENGAGPTARVTIAFKGAADGETHPRLFRPGDFIRGDLAAAEVKAGRAEWTAPPRLETKAPEVASGPFPTGAAKQPSSVQADRARTKRTSRKPAAKRG